MTLWKVHKYYDKNDNVYYDVMPYNLRGYLKCCLKWYKLKGLKWCYLFKKQAERKAMILNKQQKESKI